MTAGFKQGDLIVVSKPFAYVLKNSYRGIYCDGCLLRNESLRRCAQCSFVQYCDKKCQKQAWPYHKNECKNIKRIPEECDVDVLMFLARVIFKLNEPKMTEIAGNYSRTFANLESHVKELKEDSMRCLIIYDALQQYIGEDNVPSYDDAVEIFGKVFVNNFGIHDPESLQKIGKGLYLGGSVFDHSCDPDATYSFEGTTMFVRALNDTSTRDVKKIFISYVETMEPTQSRQEELRKAYYFTCKCSKCKNPNSDNYFTRVLDESRANDVISNTIIAVETLIEMKRNKEDPMEMLRLTEESLAQQEGVLPDTHMYRLKLMSVAMYVYSRLQRWPEAEKISLSALEPLKKIYGLINPNVVIHMYRLSHIQMSNGHVEECEKSLQQVAKAADVIYGPSHSFSKKVKNLLLVCAAAKLTKVDPALLMQLQNDDSSTLQS